MRNKVKITHPTLPGAVGECLEESLPAWLANGWVRADQAAPVEEKKPSNADYKDAKYGLLRGKSVNTHVVNLNQESPGTDLEETI